ncbi:MAG: hypothetical protein ABI970_17440 [Chloroflexota bacterium]
MSFVYDWDLVLTSFQGLYERNKDSSNGNTRYYARHGLAMAALIPQIRDLDVFRDVELNISILQLLINSKTAGVSVRLGSRGIETEHDYIVWAYYSQSQQKQTYEFDSDNIVSGLYDIFSVKPNA